jgi:hypothetical protein
MKLQKRLVARSTEATERCMAQKAKNANGRLTILSSLAKTREEAKKDEKGGKKKKQ